MKLILSAHFYLVLFEADFILYFQCYALLDDPNYKVSFVGMASGPARIQWFYCYRCLVRCRIYCYRLLVLLTTVFFGRVQ